MSDLYDVRRPPPSRDGAGLALARPRPEVLRSAPLPQFSSDPAADVGSASTMTGFLIAAWRLSGHARVVVVGANPPPACGSEPSRVDGPESSEGRRPRPRPQAAVPDVAARVPCILLGLSPIKQCPMAAV